MAKKEVEQVQAEAQPTQEAAQQPAAPGLTVQDLLQIVQVIQLTSQRGAYRAEELATVGTLYNKLVAFLESVGAIKRPQENAEEN